LGSRLVGAPKPWAHASPRSRAAEQGWWSSGFRLPAGAELRSRDSGQAQGKGGEVANLAGDTLDEVIAATTGAVIRCGRPAPAVLVASPLWLVPCVSITAPRSHFSVGRWFGRVGRPGGRRSRPPRRRRRPWGCQSGRRPARCAAPPPQAASSSRPATAASPPARRQAPPMGHLPLGWREDVETVTAGPSRVQAGSRQEEWRDGVRGSCDTLGLPIVVALMHKLFRWSRGRGR
jgi:hypothetical protein